MLQAILLTLAVSVPPNAPPVRVPPQAPPVRQLVTIKIPAAGWHIHKCPAGHEWSHHDAKGDVAEHTCPVCGLMSWTPTELNTRIVTRQASVIAGPAESKPTAASPGLPRPVAASGCTLTIITAEGCIPCHKLMAAIKADPTFTEALSGRKLTEEHHAAMTPGMTYPTAILRDAEGKVLKMAAGPTLGQLKGWLAK